MNCQKCGCRKPCECDGYTPGYQASCFACGCTKPCACDSFTPCNDPYPYDPPEDRGYSDD